MISDFEEDKMETEETKTDATQEAAAQDDLELDYEMDQFGEKIPTDPSDSDFEDDFGERLEAEPLAGEIEEDLTTDDDDDTQKPVM